MKGNALPGWPWRLFAALLALACMTLGLVGEAPPPEGEGSPSDSLSALSLPDTVTIRVLNGSGVSGLARRIQRFLQGSTDVVVWMPAEPAADADRDNYPETILVSHVADVSGARAAASLLRLPVSSIVWELGRGSGADLTIILGSDVAMWADTLIPFSNQ